VADVVRNIKKFTGREALPANSGKASNHTGVETMKKGLLALALALMWLGAVQSCSHADAPQPGPALQELNSSPGASDISSRAGEIVHLEGSFQGWEVGGCQFAEGVASNGRTRGDWLISTGSDCYYVTGGYPPGLDAMNPEHIGVRIILDARAVRDESGKIYLEFIGARRTD